MCACICTRLLPGLVEETNEQRPKQVSNRNGNVQQPFEHTHIHTQPPFLSNTLERKGESKCVCGHEVNRGFLQSMTHSPPATPHLGAQRPAHTHTPQTMGNQLNTHAYKHKTTTRSLCIWVCLSENVWQRKIQKKERKKKTNKCETGKANKHP